MSDAQEIHNLLSDEQMSDALSTYSESSLEYITDYNSGSYQGTINFDTLVCERKYVTWSDAWLSIPINVTGLSGVYDVTSLASFKSSVLSFITSCQVSITGNNTIFSDNNISLINSIRLMVEKDLDFINAEGPEILYAGPGRLTTPSSTTMGGSVISNNDTTNSSFLTRIQLLKQVSTGTTTWSTTLKVPLKYIHDFFAQLNFPMTNNRFNFTFGYATTSSLLSPWMVDLTLPTPTATLSVLPSVGACRLYYRSLKFLPSINQDIVNKLNSGFQKRVSFRCSDFYLGAKAQTTEPISSTISPATIHPLRIWVLGCPVNSLSTQGSDTVNSAFCFPMRLTGLNALIQNTQYYQRNLDSPLEQWDILKQQFPSNSSELSGSQLTYSDFFNNFRLNCIDVSRLKDRLKDPNSNVSIQVVAARDPAYTGSVDIYYVVERLQACTFMFNSSETKVIIGLSQ